jgi:multiple sugar transport system permease protein
MGPYVMKERPRRSRSLSHIPASRAALSVVLFVVAGLMIAPLVWLVVESFTRHTDAFQLPPNWIPAPFSTDNYQQLPKSIPFFRMAWNSFVVSTTSTVGCILVSVLAGYAFSRFKFRGDTVLLILFLSALMVPVQTTVIPTFILMRHLHLVDHLAALWVPALINVFAIFFFRQYFNTIPRDLDEAATIDGAGHIWILTRVIVPLSGPAVAAMSILIFEAAWNNYFGPLIFLSSREQMTLPIGLVTLQADRNGASVVVFAAITAVVIPVLVVFLVFQRWFVASVVSTGVRG